MSLIGHARVRTGQSQRSFAKKASLSFRGLQLMEEPGHDWRLSSIRKVAGALDLPADGIDLVLRHFLEQDRDSIMMVSVRINADGIASWPLHLFNFVDAFRASRRASLVRAPPVEMSDAKVRALLASTVETLCAEFKVTTPNWCGGIDGLKEPWFVAEIESLKPMALVESPVQFRKRNIFVLGNFLDRA